MSDTTAATPTTAASNPLLDFSDLPRFGDIKPEHVTPALDVLLAAAKSAVDRASARTRLPPGKTSSKRWSVNRKSSRARGASSGI